MTLSEELAWRGFINQTTLADITKLDSTDWVTYHGFDASSDSQTIGNLAAMMLDLVFARHGHKILVLAGGATSLLGDPGGKDVERPLQSEETIAHNVKRAEEQIQRVFGETKFEMVNNLDWFRDMNVLTFLRDIGKHFGISTLVSRDYIAQRIGEGGSGMSFTEFSYTLLQGYDFLHLHQKYGVNLQLAGADQWGNCLSGVDLVRKITGDEVQALTLPLIINKATGKKFGKSEAGAVWLDSAKTSVYDFYQFWLNVDDAGVPDYLKIFTTIEPDAYNQLLADFNAKPNERAAQKYLALEVTKLVHGQTAAESVKRISEVLFGGAAYSTLTATDFVQLKEQLPVFDVVAGDDLLGALVGTELASSNSEARRFLTDGAVYLNGQQVKPDAVIIADDLIHNHAILRRGKNTSAILQLSA